MQKANEFVTSADVARQRDIAESLCYAFDFELLAEPGPAEGLAVPPEAIVIAVTATGGAYVELGRTFSFVEPFAEPVPLASSFAALVRLVIELPYWRELLRACPSGSLDEMRRARTALEADFGDDLPFLEAARADLLESLPLPSMSDPVLVLHQAVVVGTPYSDAKTSLGSAAV